MMNMWTTDLIMTPRHPYSPILNGRYPNQEAGNPHHPAADMANTQDRHVRGQLRIRRRVPAVMMSRNLATTKVLLGRRGAPGQHNQNARLHQRWQPDEDASRHQVKTQT